MVQTEQMRTKINTSIFIQTFCRKDKFDNSKYFGKEIFSQYVYENYQTIDFSKFIPLLDVIDTIIAQAESHEK